MNCRVNWQEEAENQLAEIWVSALDKPAVAAASRRVDQLPALDPLSQGEQRNGYDRILFVTPIAVLYRVDPNNREVWLFSVGWSGRPA